jgi:hypothetical protein
MTRRPLDALLDEYRRVRAWSLALTRDLDADQIAWRPHDDSSAIGWHLGHTGAVNHYLVRNLTAATPSLDEGLDRLFDSATVEPARGALPPLARILAYREAVAAFTETTIARIAAGDVGAPEQLAIIAEGLLTAAVNHEYQHDRWITEVRADLGVPAAPPVPGERCELVEGYVVLRPA